MTAPNARRRAENSRLTPAQRRLRAQKAARTRWALEVDRTAATAPARAAAFDRFLAQVPADLPEHERVARAEQLQAANMSGLALQRHRERGSAPPPVGDGADVE